MGKYLNFKGSLDSVAFINVKTDIAEPTLDQESGTLDAKVGFISLINSDIRQVTPLFLSPVSSPVKWKSRLDDHQILSSSEISIFKSR